jgi:hypothetical protein
MRHPDLYPPATCSDDGTHRCTPPSPSHRRPRTCRRPLTCYRRNNDSQEPASPLTRPRATVATHTRVYGPQRENPAVTSSGLLATPRPCAGTRCVCTVRRGGNCVPTDPGVWEQNFEGHFRGHRAPSRAAGRAGGQPALMCHTLAHVGGAPGAPIVQTRCRRISRPPDTNGAPPPRHASTPPPSFPPAGRAWAPGSGMSRYTLHRSHAPPSPPLRPRPRSLPRDDTSHRRAAVLAAGAAAHGERRHVAINPSPPLPTPHAPRQVRPLAGRALRSRVESPPESPPPSGACAAARLRHGSPPTCLPPPPRAGHRARPPHAIGTQSTWAAPHNTP